MTKNDSRVERKKESNKLEEKSSLPLNKLYYWIIGFLFFILFALVIFIFSQSGDQVDLDKEESRSENLQEETADDNSSSETEASNEEAVEDKEDDPVEEEATEDTENEENDEDETLVNEDAPLDTNYAVNYDSGSADRIAIKEEVMKVTGLSNNLIEYWVGNNGPGRVSATVANPDQSKIYEVQLQYGEGQWHVTSYESLNSLPEDYD